MHIPEIILLLLLIIAVVALVAQRAHVAPPVVFLITGAGLGLIPQIPMLNIEPEYMLVIFLPPLLMEAAYFTSLRDFKMNVRPIMHLAVGLVFATAAAVAGMLVGLLPGVSWALGFVLGAIVSPPDAVAATSIVKRMNVPKRIVSILEGESLINDATGLVLYKFAVAAVVTGSFYAPLAAAQFSWMAFAGVVVGIVLARIYMDFFPEIQDTSVEIITTFIVPYAAYILAESIGGSGVLAVVAAGLVVGWYGPERFSPRFRLPAEAVWKMVTFTLNGIVFLLIGLQFPEIIHRLLATPEYSATSLVLLVVATCVVITAVRFAWVFTFAYVVRYFFPDLRTRDPYPNWQNVFIVAWTSMRGVVSLATALALPLTLADGTPFPHRDLIIFLAVTVIFFTLVAQGLPLPWLLRKLPLTFNPAILHEDWHARVQVAQRALTHLEELAADGAVHGPALERLRGHYQDRLQSLGDGPNTPLIPTEVPTTRDHPILQAENRLWQEVINIERHTLISLRKTFEIGDDVMNDILRELDLLATRFGDGDQ